MNGWRKAKWGDIAVLEYGKALREYREGRGATQVFGTNGPIGYSTSAPHSPGPGVIVGRKGAYRGIHFTKSPFAVIDTAFWLKSTEPFDLRWAYYELLTHDINSMDSGSAIPSTSREAFYAMPVLVPPLEAQKAIAATLGALDDKIESNRRLLEHVSALIDALASRLLGRVPVETLPLESLVEFNRVMINPHSTDAVRYIDIASVSPGRINSVQDLAWAEAPSRARRGVSDGDVIYSTVRPGRRAFSLIVNPASDSVVSTGFAVMSPSRRLGSSMLASVVGDSRFAEFLESVAHGSAYPVVSIQAMGSYPVVVPKNVADAEQFEVNTMPLRRRVAQAQEESQRLAALRNALLPELLSGRIRASVGDVSS